MRVGAVGSAEMNKDRAHRREIGEGSDGLFRRHAGTHQREHFVECEPTTAPMRSGRRAAVAASVSAGVGGRGVGGVVQRPVPAR